MKILHQQLPLHIIKDLQKILAGTMSKIKSPVDGIKAKLVFVGKKYEVNFSVEFGSNKWKSLNVGKYFKKIQFIYLSKSLVFESLYLENRSSSGITGSVDFFYSKGYSKTKKYYYRLIIPLVEELNFHYQIEECLFTTDLGYDSRKGTKADINGDTIFISVIHDMKNQHFLSIEAEQPQAYKSFNDKAFAIKNAMGFLTGYLAGDEGYFFAYNKMDMQIPIHYYHCALRNTIRSSYTPICTNPFTWLHDSRKRAEKYYESKVLRTVNLTEFSLLSQRLHDSLDLSSAIMLILESSIASLLFMPGGFAIALESMSDIVMAERKIKLAPIKDKATSKSVRENCLKIINEHCSNLQSEDLKTLTGRIEQINQITNKARLKAPFELLNITLSPQDLQILESRNDILHGRIPDITKVGVGRSTVRKNKDLYYASMRFYTLLNMLILKWIGYDNYVLNHPKLQQKYCKIALKESPYRKV